ncbi:lanC-like protein GCL2 [Lotus japonicus]|uniref:lanC-like protein GCL2 n=1 Tax=Lotus japonicus TaxID=34305 RepID=UPI0025833B19|nr:lanC-like protein GCL2 [Lotus japonicus]
MEDPNPKSESAPEATPSTPQENQEAAAAGAGAGNILSNAPLLDCLKRVALDLRLAVTVGAVHRDIRWELLTMPHASLSECFKRAAHELKLTIVLQTYGFSGELEVKDYTLKHGLLGTAFLLFKSYQVTGNTNELVLCSQIVKACDNASLRSRNITFLSGRAGVCALGAVAAHYCGNSQLSGYYLTQLLKIELPEDLHDELTYGRAGFLWACLFLNKHLGQDTVPYQYTAPFVDEIIKYGRALGSKEECPLMFELFGEELWGAAQGSAGIMHVLMDMKLKPDELEDVKGTLKYMIHNHLPSGNYSVSEVDRNDGLLNWCDGAPGIAITLVKAAKVFKDKEFLGAAMELGERIWKRGWPKHVGICHGISGNAYVFLSLYQLTGDLKYLYGAKAFACLALDRALVLITQGDRPYSLFEGIGGLAYLLLDMVDLSQSKFPAYEL